MIAEGTTQIVLAIIAMLGGGGGLVAILNRRKIRAEATKTNAEADAVKTKAEADAVKTKAEAAKIITDSMKEILGEYRKMNDEHEEEMAELKRDFLDLKSALTNTTAEMAERETQYKQDQALQDLAIENVNAKILKLELLNVIYVFQIRSFGVEPLVKPNEIMSVSVEHLSNLARSLTDSDESRKAAKVQQPTGAAL